MVSIFKTQCCFSPFGPVRGKRGEERGRVSNIWSAHGDVVIQTSLAGHTEGIKPWREREREREGGRESPKGKGESQKWRKRNRGRERERVKKGSPKKDRVRELRLHVAVEGMVWIWRGTSSQVRLSGGTLQASLFIFFSVIGCVFCQSRPLPPPSVVFSTLSFCPVCWLHVFVGFWTWSWELCRVCVAA